MSPLANRLIFVAILSIMAAPNVMGLRIIDRLKSVANSQLEKLKGDDVCAGCDEELCNQAPACGYVQVKNGGGYVAKICVNGLNNASKQEFCCTSGGFDLGQTAQIKLPCWGMELSMTAEEDVFVDSWSVVATENYKNNTVHACYKMYGTTLDPHWETENCN